MRPLNHANTHKLLAIIARIVQEPCTAMQLKEHTGRSDNTLSTALHNLRAAGLVYVMGTQRQQCRGKPPRVYAWNPKPHLCQDCFEPLEQGE